jgi:hypothetical protein
VKAEVVTGFFDEREERGVWGGGDKSCFCASEWLAKISQMSVP